MHKKPRFKKVPPLFVIRATGALRSFLMNTARRMFPPDYVMMEYASSFWVAKAIGVAADLGIADVLNEKPLHISELAKRLEVHEGSLIRLLRVLSGHGIFKHLGRGVYANTRLSEALGEDRHSMKYFIRHHLGENNWTFVGDLEDCVRTGQNAIKKRTGLEPFDFLQQNPEKSALFSRAMTDSNLMSLPLFMTAYNFGKFRHIVDVGGGHGFMVSALAGKFSSLKVTVLDLPGVAQQASYNFGLFGAEDRCSFVEGDFFGQIPAGGDLYILKNILHDWDDEACIKIMTNIRKAMIPGARLLVIDSVISEKNRPSFGKTLDLQMLIGTSGGRERTADEFRRVFEAAGFILNKLINTATPFYFLEGKPLSNN